MLKEYLIQLRKNLMTPEATAKDRERYAYACAYLKGEEGLKAFRNRLIAKEINSVHDRDAQFAILFNKDTEPEEYEAYQAFRVLCKAKADERMAKLKAELEEALTTEV